MMQHKRLAQGTCRPAPPLTMSICERTLAGPGLPSADASALPTPAVAGLPLQPRLPLAAACIALLVVQCGCLARVADNCGQHAER